MSAISEMAVPTRRLSVPTLILTSTFALGANLVWLAYNIFILPVQVQAVTSEATKGIAVGVLAGVAIGIAVIVNIMAGIVSDHSKSRFGRRRPRLLDGKRAQADGACLRNQSLCEPGDGVLPVAERHGGIHADARCRRWC